MKLISKIPEFKDYSITIDGKIISHSRKMFNGKTFFISKEKYLNPRIDRKGYLYK